MGQSGRGHDALTDLNGDLWISLIDGVAQRSKHGKAPHFDAHSMHVGYTVSSATSQGFIDLLDSDLQVPYADYAQHAQYTAFATHTHQMIQAYRQSIVHIVCCYREAEPATASAAVACATCRRSLYTHTRLVRYSRAFVGHQARCSNGLEIN